MGSNGHFAINFSQGGSAARQLWLSLWDYFYWLYGAVIGYWLFFIMAHQAQMELLMAGLDG